MRTKTNNVEIISSDDFYKNIVGGAWKGKYTQHELLELNESLLNPLFDFDTENHKLFKDARNMLIIGESESHFKSYISHDWATFMNAAFYDFFHERGTHVSPRSTTSLRGDWYLTSIANDDTLFFPDYPSLSFAGTQWDLTSFFASKKTIRKIRDRELSEPITNRLELLQNIPHRTLFHDDLISVINLLVDISNDESIVDVWDDVSEKPLKRKIFEISQTMGKYTASVSLRSLPLGELAQRAREYVELGQAYELKLQSMGLEPEGVNLEVLNKIARLSKMIPSRKLYEEIDNVYLTWAHGLFHSEWEMRVIPKAYREAMRTGMLKDIHRFFSLVEDSLTTPKNELVFQEITESSVYSVNLITGTNRGRYRMSEAQRDEMIEGQRRKITKAHDEALASLLLEG